MSNRISYNNLLAGAKFSISKKYMQGFTVDFLKFFSFKNLVKKYEKKFYASYFVNKVFMTKQQKLIFMITVTHCIYFVLMDGFYCNPKYDFNVCLCLKCLKQIFKLVKLSQKFLSKPSPIQPHVSIEIYGIVEK